MWPKVLGLDNIFLFFVDLVKIPFVDKVLRAQTVLGLTAINWMVKCDCQGGITYKCIVNGYILC